MTAQPTVPGPVNGGPIGDTEEGEDAGEDDKEAEVNEDIVILLLLPSSQLSEFHLQEDSSVPVYN